MLKPTKYAKLRGRIIEKYGSQIEFCREVGLSETSLSKKMQGKTGFKYREINKWCKLLDIDVSEIGTYFFCQ